MDLAAAERKHLWHPFTLQQDGAEDDSVIIESADRCELFDVEGRRYIDGVSSLWGNVHGHRHPLIDIAVREQMDRVSHSTPLGLTHRPAIELAARLVEIAPPGLTRVCYSDSGPTAVEIALRTAFQYWRRRGERRDRFIALRDAYHGHTIGAPSFGGIDLYHSTYRPLPFDALRAEPGDAAEMERLLSRHAGEVAAVIVEPLLQGAAGMLVHPDGYLRRVRDLCDRFGVLLVCDEVLTGFGRTGRMFACEHEQVAPDLMCVATGIAGGYPPLAATLATEGIHEGFLGRHEELRAFVHGHAHSGNPLACAAAIATLKLFEQERTLEQLQPKIALLGELLEPIAAMPGVAEVRRRGFMTAIELEGPGPEACAGQRVALAARRRGAIVRPLGDAVLLMPPLAIAVRELRRLVTITADSIAEVARARQLRTAA